MFDFLEYPFMLRALLAGSAVALVLGWLGTFVVTKKMSFIGDGLAHASLAGIALALLVGWAPLPIAIILAVLVAVIIYFLEKKTGLSGDTAIAIMFTTGMALGIILLHYYQGYQPELISYLFGNILAINYQDLYFILAGSAIILLLLSIFYRRLLFATVDPIGAYLAGIKPWIYDLLLYIMAAVAIILSLKLVGIILVSALLVMPSAIARFYTTSFKAFSLLAAVISWLIVFIGLTASYHLDWPSGATIILAGSLLFFISVLINTWRQSFLKKVFYTSIFLIGLFFIGQTAMAAYLPSYPQPTNSEPEMIEKVDEVKEAEKIRLNIQAVNQQDLQAINENYIPYALEVPDYEESNFLVNNNYKLDNFSAKVIEIMETAEKTRADGSHFIQQNIRLQALDGQRIGQEFIYYGISEIEVGNMPVYKLNDKVYVDVFIGSDGSETVYIVDYVRSRALLLLSLVFIFIVILVGRLKGFKALISLTLTFFIILKFILPQILAGRDPFVISLLGGLIIMALIIYITEGWHKKSHLAIFSVFLSLVLTLILSVVFTNLANLSGLAQDEAVFLIGVGQKVINFKGLLLAGMLIGALGVLDDIVVGQIEAVYRIREANPKLPSKRIFHLAYKVGNTHLGAIINTLFLTYAGAALPLLLLFIIGQESGLSVLRALNTEAVATEIIRTMVGSIGVMASMPIATFLAAVYLPERKFSWWHQWTKIWK